MPLAIGLVARHRVAVRLRDRNYAQQDGVLSADVIVDVSGGRAPRSETDALTIGGMRFDVICTEPGGRHRLQEPGNCPPFVIGNALEVRFVQLPSGRYRLAPLQILRLR